MIGPEHISQPLDRVLEEINVDLSDLTLGQIGALAMIEIAKIMGWPLDHGAWSDPDNLPADPEVDTLTIEGAATTPEELQRRLVAIAETTPPTDPQAMRIYTINAEAGPRAARQAIVDAYASGEMNRNQATTLLFVLGLRRL